MEPTLTLNINAARGYSADQIIKDGGALTLADLLEAVQDAIEQYGEDAMVVTKDPDNVRYGAGYGMVIGHEMFAAVDEEGE